MAKLTAKNRAALKPSQFGLPDKARTKKARKQTGELSDARRGPRRSAPCGWRRSTARPASSSKSDYNRIRRKAHKILKKKK